MGRPGRFGGRFGTRKTDHAGTQITLEHKLSKKRLKPQSYSNLRIFLEHNPIPTRVQHSSALFSKIAPICIFL